MYRKLVFSLLLSVTVFALHEDFEFAPRIIHGQPIREEFIPTSLAVMGFEENLVKSYCGGTLIAEDVVLTAAHCVEKELDFLISTQSNLLPLQIQPDKSRLATHVAIPKNYNKPSKNDHDIALIFLETPFWHIKPAKLINPKAASMLQDGLPVHIVGWGLEEPNLSSMVQHNWQRRKVYAKSFIDEISQYKMRVGRSVFDPRQCSGDSGSATYLENSVSKELFVIGVVSHGYTWDGPCMTGSYNMRVDAYVPWIQETMQNACDKGWRNHRFCP
ncbi:MAG: trypsin-like serine protease [Deltaproteobacteria bacterium]|nr:trypsin-like serine protease [Deltaproteobacteria bacterium]